MKKPLVILLAIAFLAATPLFAGASDNAASLVHGKSKPELQMTDDQKSKLINLKTQILELKKQIIQHNVDNGVITKEKAQKMEERINVRLKALQSGDLGRAHRPHSPKS